MTSKLNKKLHNINKDDNNFTISDLNSRYSKLNSSFLPDNLKFEIKYFLISLSVLFSTFTNIYKNNLSNYNFKLLFILIIYFLRRLISKIWFQFRIREKLVDSVYNSIYFIVLGILAVDVVYLLFSLFINNSFFHLMALFMVAILQIPQLKIFPSNEKRYEGATQEMLFNGKSKFD